MAYTKVKPLMVTSFPSSRLTGAFGAISGASLTGLGEGIDTKSASNDPAINTNPSAVGHVWVNKSSGEMFVCTDKTAGENVWMNVGGGSGYVHDTSTFHGEIAGFITGGNLNADNSFTNIISRFSFLSEGNDSDHGDLTVGRYQVSGYSSATHGFTAGGYNGGGVNVIDKFAFASAGNAVDHGDLLAGSGHRAPAGCYSSTHGYVMGGLVSAGGSPKTDQITRFSFSATGNSVDVGNLTQAKVYGGGCMSATDGYYIGGTNSSLPGSPEYAFQDKFSFASSSNASNVGNIGGSGVEALGAMGCSSTTHGYASGGYNPSPAGNVKFIEKFSFASNGNTTSVGNLDKAAGGAPLSGKDNGYICGANEGAGALTTIQKFSFTTDGNAASVGDMTDLRNNLTGQQY